MLSVDAEVLSEDLFEVTQTFWLTMLRRPAKPAPVATAPEPAEADLIQAWSPLSGAWRGALVFRCSRDAAKAFARWFLNDTAEPLRDDDVVDCVAEMVNVICGNFKASLPEVTAFGLPTVATGRPHDPTLPEGPPLVELAFVTAGDRWFQVALATAEPH